MYPDGYDGQLPVNPGSKMGRSECYESRVNGSFEYLVIVLCAIWAEACMRMHREAG